MQKRTHHTIHETLLLVYEALNGLAPAYLSDMLCNTWVSTGPPVLRHVFELFQSAAQKLWVSWELSAERSESVDIFVSKLKTYCISSAWL